MLLVARSDGKKVLELKYTEEISICLNRGPKESLVNDDVSVLNTCKQKN